MNAFTTVSLVIVYVSAFVPWAFIVLYQMLTKGAWRRERMGWHVMALTAVDGAIFTMPTLAEIWPQLALQPWYRWVYLAIVAGIPAVTVWRSVILWRLYYPRQQAVSLNSEGVHMRDFWSHVEAKVKAAGIGALVASLVAALINALLNGSVIPSTPHAWVQFLIIVLTPPIVSFASGWAARHTSIPPVTPPRLPTTIAPKP